MTVTTELPAGNYLVDTRVSHIGFDAKAILGLKVKGRFDRFESVVDVGTSPAESSVALTIWTDSVQTGIKMRDRHLRGDKVFEVDRFPTMKFHSTAIVQGETGLDIEGLLRVRDISQPVAFHATPVEQPGLPRYTATMIVTPADFGISRPGTTKPLTMVLDVTLGVQRPTAD